MLPRNYLHVLLFIISVVGFAQEKPRDSTKINTLDEVVVTGQFEPQSIRKSVFNVRVITKEDIQRQAANNLADVLNQYLNITITPSSNTGRSTVSMFGLDGQYFKIVVDNVPLVSDSGLGNNIDLTQINLDDIEQIEIIEGSMGVTHGGNAVSGILNIISKKSSKYKWEISATAQEETVGKEFKLFDEGKHIQALRVAHTISDHWYVSVGGNRNDFKGYSDGQKGKDHAINDGLRGYRWLPKEQYTTNAMLSYKRNDFRFFYKFDYFNENIDFFNPVVSTEYSPSTGMLKYSKDKRYSTDRFYHHINGTGKVFSTLTYNVSLSHQKQQRDVEDFDYYFDKGETGNQRKKNQSTEAFYSTGTLSNFFKNEIVDLQLGYELSNNNGFAIVDGDNQTQKEVRKRLENYDFFVASEIKATHQFSIRPGLRFSSQSKFENQYATSLGLRYLLDHGIELRTSLGKSFRTPNFEELYSKINFSGHKFFGNENLVPETSTSYELNIKKATSFNAEVSLLNDVAVSYMDIDDRIDMAFIGLDPVGNDPIYQYVNISKYKMWNISSNHQAVYKNWLLRAGFSLVGISQLIDNGESVSDDKFIYSLQINGNLSYTVPAWNTVFSVYYKFNGKQQQFVQVGSDFKRSDIESYSWMDASVRKTFYKKRFDVTVGARNLFDVTQVQQSQASSTAGHTNSTDILLGYGRSYYCKLTYNLTF